MSCCGGAKKKFKKLIKEITPKEIVETPEVKEKVSRAERKKIRKKRIKARTERIDRRNEKIRKDQLKK